MSENHWACGWVEWLAIHESNTEALAKAQELADSLNSYPVLDEQDWSDREQESANNVWRDCYDWRERVAYMRKYASHFEFTTLSDMLYCARGNYFNGYASELLN